MQHESRANRSTSPKTFAARRAACLAALVTLCLCAQGGDIAHADDGAKTYKIIAVLGPLGDPIFSTIEKGAVDAAKAAGVDFEYTAPNGFDNLSQDLARLIEAGASRNPDAMVIGNFIPDAENGPIRAAVEAGIPVIISGDGIHNWQELGATAFVGNDSKLAGMKAAQLYLAAGSKHGLCINHVPGNPSTEARCAAFDEDMKAAGMKATILNMPYSSQGSPQQILQTIEGTLTADSTIDAIFTLGSGFAEKAMQAVEEGGFSDRVKVGTTDVSKRTLQAVQDGKLLFDLDQQPYLEGYYPVLIAAQYLKYGLKPVTEVATGPLVITKDNVNKVLAPPTVPYRGAM